MRIANQAVVAGLGFDDRLRSLQELLQLQEPVDYAETRYVASRFSFSGFARLLRRSRGCNARKIGCSVTNTTGGDPAMGAQENKQTTQDAYAAFSSGDAEGAMRDIDDSIEWTVRGDNALTGAYKGKQAVGELWGKYTSKDFRTEPHDFIADGDKVVVLTTVHLDGEAIEGADVLTYNAEGKLIGFDTLADEAVSNHVFAK